MAIIYSKKGIAFSFLVIFLVIVLFAFINLRMSNNQFTKDSVFVDSRINYVSEELFYFKNVYLQNVVSYSFYNTMDALINSYGRTSDYSKLNQNYTMFNDLIFEGMMNGTFEGVLQSDLVGGRNKTLNYFFNEFISDFNTNYRANLTLNVININVYEKTPYYLSVQLLVNMSVTTDDNISSWSSFDNYFVTVPISDLPEPDFLYYEDELISSKSVEYNLATQDWNLANFQRTINQSYSSLFFEDKHKYQVGNSYLKRFLNISFSSYKDVIGFWSFDYDEDENMVYDSSLNNNYSFHYGNSISLYSFDNNSSLSNVKDLSSYNNSGNLIDDVDCLYQGINGNACYFDGAGDMIEVPDFTLIEREISVFGWIYINDTISGDNLNVICGPNEYFCYWLNLDDNSISVKLNNAVKTGSDSFINFKNVNISRNNWHSVGFTYDGNYTTLYFDGIKYGSELEDDGNDLYSGSLNGVVGDLIIGEDFEGLIDEVGIYSRVLARDEIATLYNNKKVLFADYKDTFHGKGVHFDGIDDYINLGNNEKYNLDHQLITIETWIKLNDISRNNTIIDKGKFADNGWGLRINKGYIQFGFHGGHTSGSVSKVINKTDYWYHIVMIGGDRNQADRLYINGKEIPLINTGQWVYTELTNYNLTIGKASDTNSNYFNGIIDEIKIYNRSLNENEIENNYLNYDSFGKGCCNYILLINPTKFGYDDESYLNNISYSSKVFYDYHIRGIESNISLYNITNVTSFDTSKDYYNFLFDDCIQRAFSVSDYQTNDSSIDMSVYKLDGQDNASCTNLISLGIY